MADGLESLTAMRTKTTSRRTLPPPRHQPRQTPVTMPPPATEQSADLPTVQAAPIAPDKPRQPAPPPPVSPAHDRSQTPPLSTELAKVSIYLDEHADAYLETVRTTARSAKPRVDATRSAVVRLALSRLAEQLRPADVVAELQRSAATHTGPGRKRA
jgi:hypothetical protein